MRRFKGPRSSSEHNEGLQTATADFVLQMGNKKVPLKAEKLLGNSMRVSRKSDLPSKAEKILGAPVLNDEEKALEAFSRMQEVFSNTSRPQGSGNWVPFSPDDAYPMNGQHNPCEQSSTHYATETLRNGSSSTSLPESYDSSHSEEQTYNTFSSVSFAPDCESQQRGHPTIFDNLRAPPPSSRDYLAADSRRPEPTSRRRGPRYSSNQRKLDLAQLLPQSRSSTGRHGSSSTYQAPKFASKSDQILGRPVTSPVTRRQTCDASMFDTHKTHVRRPPKGIQNWFDAYTYSDEDEDEEDDVNDDDVEEAISDDEELIEEEPHQPSHRTLADLEPQELPADEPPPAYSAPSREVSRASEKSASFTTQTDPILNHLHPTERTTAQQETDRYPSESESHSWDSIQSSHIGRIAPDSRDGHNGTLNTNGRTTFSASETEYTDEDDGKGERNTFSKPPQAQLRDRDGERQEGEQTLPSGPHIMAVTEQERMLLDLMRRKQIEMQSFTEGYQMALQAEQQRATKQATGQGYGTMDPPERQEMERRGSQLTSLPTPMDDNEMRQQLSSIQNQHGASSFQMQRFLATSNPSEGPFELPARRPSGELLPATVYTPVGTPSNQSPAFNQGIFAQDETDAEDVKKRVQHFIDTKGAVPPLNIQIKTMQRPSKARLASSKIPSPVREVREEVETAPPAIPKRSSERRNTRTQSDLTAKVSVLSFDAEGGRDSPVSAFPTGIDTIRTQHQNASAPELSPRTEEPSEDLKSHFDSSSTSLAQNASYASPFSCLINKAAETPQHRRAESSTAEIDFAEDKTCDSPTSYGEEQRFDSELPPGAKKIPMPLSRFNISLPTDPNDSMISISSAGEDVLAAWQELGGMSDLNLKRKARV